MIEPTSVLRLRSDIRFRIVDDEAVVVRQAAGEVLVLNEVGGRVLELFDGSRTVADLSRILAAEYDVEPAALTADLLAFARDLEAVGLAELPGKPGDGRP